MDASLGLVESVGDYYPKEYWQRGTIHFYRNVFSHVPSTRVQQVALILKAIHAQESLDAATEKADLIVQELQRMKLAKAAEQDKRSTTVRATSHASQARSLHHPADLCCFFYSIKEGDKWRL